MASSDSVIGAHPPDTEQGSVSAAGPNDQVQHILTSSPPVAGLIPTSTPAVSGWSTTSLSSLTIASDPFPYFDKFITGPRAVEQSSWLTDLELMHQYTAITYQTLPRAADLQHIWQTQIPKLALSNIFLLHQILAISAHHQSQLRPDLYSHYTICASLHQNKAVAGLRTALARITEETCHEVFVASSLLSICAFASLSSYGGVSERPWLEDLIDVFQLIRGMSRILDSYTNLLHKGELSMLFFREGNSKPAPFLDSVNEQLQLLELSLLPQDEATLVCRQTIIEVVAWIQSVIRSTGSPGLRASLSLPICLRENFMDLVRQHNPVALVIVAHYSVILHDSGLDNWYLRGWGRSVIEDIAQIVGPSWHKSLEWPLMMLENSCL